MSVGLGYGMAETVLIVGLNQITNVRMALVARGGAEALTAKWPDIDAQGIIDIFQSTPVSEVYLGVVKRLSLTVVYLFVALLLYQGVYVFIQARRAKERRALKAAQKAAAQAAAPTDGE